MAEPNYNDVMTALRNADAAGDKESAVKLAQIANNLRNVQPTAAPENPGILDRADSFLKTANMLAPAGLVTSAARTALGGMNEVSDTAGNLATEGASRVGLPPEVAGGLGVAANLGVNTALAGGIGKAATVLSSPLKGTAEWLMQSAVKPREVARRGGDWLRARDTMFQKGLTASEGTIDAAQSKVSNLENTIQGVLNEAANRGAAIDKDAVIKSLDSLREKTALKLDKAENLKQIGEAQQRFAEGIDEIKNLTAIPVDLANKIKQSFYRELVDRSSAYQPGAKLTYYDKAQKEMAGNIREQVAKEVPEVAPSIKEQSELLNVIKVLKPQIGVEGNKNIVGLGVLSPSMQKTFVWMLDRYPWFKSAVAQGLYHGSERIPQATAGLGVAEAIRERQQ